MAMLFLEPLWIQVHRRPANQSFHRPLARSVPFKQLAKRIVQGNPALEVLSLALLKINQAGIETIQHFNARRDAILGRALLLEKSGPLIARDRCGLYVPL